MTLEIEVIIILELTKNRNLEKSGKFEWKTWKMERIVLYKPCIDYLNLSVTGQGDWVDESEEKTILAQVMAQSHREYYESLSSSSKASCSKYTWLWFCVWREYICVFCMCSVLSHLFSKKGSIHSTYRVLLSFGYVFTVQLAILPSFYVRFFHRPLIFITEYAQSNEV